MAPVVGVPRLVLRLVKTVQNALICQVFFGVVRGFGRNQLSHGKKQNRFVEIHKGLASSELL